MHIAALYSPKYVMAKSVNNGEVHRYGSKHMQALMKNRISPNGGLIYIPAFHSKQPRGFSGTGNLIIMVMI